MDILSDLNQRQREAVTAENGPILVVAGPGSGKTKTLTHRIAYLIANGVRPQNILAVTFTNKAAGEMKGRVQQLLAVSSPDIQYTRLQSPSDSFGGQAEYNIPVVGTFHSICARILRKDGAALGYTPGFTIYDEDDSLQLIRSLIRELNLDPKQFGPQKIRAIISSLKNNLITPENYEAESDYPFYQKIRGIYELYQKRLLEQNAMDFDDLLMKVVELFKNLPKTLEQYQNWFQYVLVDEFQDTNIGQYKIANHLAQKHRNIYCIGDLDQSIYSFRGADYRNVLNFEKDWPNAKIIILEQNYRSTQNILDTAHHIIAANERRKEKILWTQNGRGEPVAIKEVADELAEGEFITSEIELLVREKGLALNDFVVLYRINAQSRAIEESFLRAGFPYKIIGGIKFFQRKEIKDLLAFLRLSINKNDAIALSRIAEIPAKFLNPISSPLSSSPYDHLPPSASLKTNKSQKIYALIASITAYSEKAPLAQLLEYIIRHAGFEQWLRDGTEKGEERWDNVRELLSVCTKYSNEAPGQALRMLLEEAALAQEADNVEYKNDLVNLMTLHAAKGLEFPVVFIAGCEQGLLPHSRALFSSTSDELEEERRLCYVGVTRAKQKLYLLFAQHRMLFGRTQSNPPSEFLRHIPEHLIKFLPTEEETVIELD